MKQIYFIAVFILSLTKVFSSAKTLVPTATISGGTTICQNTTGVLITFTGTGGNAPYTFTYNINGTLQTPISTTGSNNSVTVAVNTTTATTLNYNLISFHDTTIPITEINQTGTATIIINPQPNANMGGTGSGSTFGGFPVFRICNNVASQFTFTNTSTSSTLNTNYTIDWGDGTPNFTGSTWTSLTHTYQIGIWNLIYTINGSNGCSISKTYIVFVGSNPAVSLGNPGNTDICNANSLTFPITGTSNNPPGTIYTVTFNDGSTPQVFNHPPPTSVTHSFTTSSCGTTSSDGSNSYPNSFSANIVATNPCSTSSVGVVPIYVSANPVANFTGPISGCVNNQICFTNTSTGNQVISNTCSSPSIVWSISPSTGYTIAGSSSLGNDFGSTDSSLWLSGSNNLCVNFNTPGTYTITIKTGNKCGVDIETKTVCIEPPITPSFTINTNSGCIPLAVTTNNTTSPLNQCTTPTYSWNVTYASGNCGTSSAFTYTNGTSSSSTSPSFNFTEAGTYTIRLTATNSCSPPQTTTQIVTVKKPPTITAINGILNNYCGPTNISPTAIVNSCAPVSSTLTYAWSFPGGTPATSTSANPGSISYSAAGTHIVSLTISNECGASSAFTKTFTINETPVLTTTPLNQTICSGTLTAPINLTASITGTTFTWTATATTGVSGFQISGTSNTIPAQTITTTSSSSGTVTYAITPSINGCNGTPVNYVITVNPAPILTTQPASSTVCQGGTPTVLAVALNNTSGSPTYQWYSNTVNNSTTGTIIAGETNTTYTPPATTIGTTYYYCVITLASGGCSTIKSNVASVTIATSATISQPISIQNLCVGTTISTPLSVIPSGGTGTPTYQWYSNSVNSNSGGTLIIGATNQSYTPPVFNSAGSFYYYVVVNYVNGCGNLTSNTAEVVVFNDPTIATQPITTQTLCQTATPTNLEVVPNGSGTFTYQWYSNSSNNTTSGTLITGASNSIYTPPTTVVGTRYYYCIITQNGISGCAVTSTIATVIITTSPSFTSQPNSSTICLGQTPTQLVVAYSNGSGTPNYQWYSNTSNTTLGATPIASANSSSYTPPATTIGTIYYYCVITFPSLSGGCSVITSNIAQVTINPISIITPKSTTICSGATFTIAPTNSPFDVVPIGTTYTWSTPTINPIGSVVGATSQTIPQNDISQTLINSITTPATVTYTITPTIGTCVGNNFTVTVTVNPSTNPNTTKTDITCFGANNGSITTNITGGVPFSSGAPYLVSWVGPNSFTSSSPNISGLMPGNYTLTINDAGGCPVTNNYIINEPSDIVITTDVDNNVTCFGNNNGNIGVSITGGTPPYNYTWTRNTINYASTEDISNLSPGNYILSVTDANNCGPRTATFVITEPPLLQVNLVSQTNINCYGFATGAINSSVVGGTPIEITPGVFDYSYSWTGPNGYTSSNQNISNLIAGNYNLTVTDAEGCVDTLSVTLTQSSEIIINAITTPIVCYGDNNATIAVTLSGGNAPYQVQWSNLAVGLNQNNLSPGNYTITVTDALGCQKSSTINIPSPPLFDVSPVATNISCFGANDGSIVLNFVGGIAPVNLVWSDGSTAGTTRNNLGPGTYSVVITDSKPCTITRTFTILEPQLLVLSANTVNALDCNNANSGQINLLVSGGTPPFSYLWNNGATTEDLNSIPAGNYQVTVTDARGCVKTAQYSITRPNPLVLSVNTTTNATCSTFTVTQDFTAVASGGVPPYTYNWSSGTVSGTNNQSMTTTTNGLVTLTVTDAIGCFTNYSLNVDIPTIGNPSFSINSIGYTSYGIYSILDPIQFTSVITGDYISVLWDFGDGTFSNEVNPIHTYSSPNDYVVTQTVTYPFGCVYSQIITLKVEKGYLLVVPTAFTPTNNDGINDTFRPVTKGLKNVRLDIYDTWGSLIYSEVGEVLVGWNGKIKEVSSENGNYYAKVSGETFYGTIINENQTFVLIK